MTPLGIVPILISALIHSSWNFFTSCPYLLALTAAVARPICSVIDKVGVQMLRPVLYIWFINLWMTIFTGLYLNNAMQLMRVLPDGLSN